MPCPAALVVLLAAVSMGRSVVFGAGSTAGMLVLSALIGLPFVLTSRHSATLHTLLRLAAGSAGLGLGIWLR